MFFNSLRDFSLKQNREEELQILSSIWEGDNLITQIVSPQITARFSKDLGFQPNDRAWRNARAQFPSLDRANWFPFSSFFSFSLIVLDEIRLILPRVIKEIAVVPRHEAKFSKFTPDV